MAYYPGATTGGGAPGSETYPMSLVDYTPPGAMTDIPLEFQPWLQSEQMPDSLWNYQAPTLDAWSTTPRDWDWATKDMFVAREDGDGDGDNGDGENGDRGAESAGVEAAGGGGAHEAMYPGHTAAATAAGGGGISSLIPGTKAYENQKAFIAQNKKDMAKYGIVITRKDGKYSSQNWKDLQTARKFGSPMIGEAGGMGGGFDYGAGTVDTAAPGGVSFGLGDWL